MSEKQTDVQKDQYSHIWYIPTVLYVRKTYRQTDRQADRQTGQTEKKDKQTNKQTNKQTDRQYMSEKQTDIQEDQYSHIWYIPTLLYIRKTYRQTDRQTYRTDRKE
jgi:nitrate reductase NapAB chaperone NapD